VSAALSGLNANLGCFAAGGEVDGVDDVVEVDCGVDWDWDSEAVVIEVADAVSFRGGAGGVWIVSGRFVSRRDDGGGGCDVEDDDDGGGTMVCFGCSCVEMERERIQHGGIRC
jgi:hypothetical protein